MSKALKKGSMVAMKGSLQYRDYQDKNGKGVKVTEVVVDDFVVVNSKKSEKVNASNLPKEQFEESIPF